MVLFVPLFDRCRPGPVLSTAPTGAPAMFFRRSPFMTVVSVVFCLAFAVWAGALAVVLYGHGHGVWASVPAPLAGVLLWPVAVLLTGRIKPGGLWLTPVGLEYRKEAVSWTLPWPDVDRIDPAEPGVQTGALPYASGSRWRPCSPWCSRCASRCLRRCAAPCGGSGAGSVASHPDGCASTASTWPAVRR